MKTTEENRRLRLGSWVGSVFEIWEKKYLGSALTLTTHIISYLQMSF